MRLRRLDLARYGHFTDHSFELPAGNIDFHIVFGPNEAGKSTALSAIEDLLFGVPMQSPYNFLHDYASMRIGAVLENGDESLEIVRRKGSKDTLLGADGLPFSGGEAVLRPFLAGSDRSFFERMFSLDHVRLEKGGREILEAKDEIGQMLFSAGAGIADLRDRLTGLSEEADGLWAKRRAGHRKYYQAEDKLKTARSDRRQQTLTANDWQELKRSFERAEEAHADVEGKFKKVSAERTRLGRIRRVYRYVRRKAKLEEQIADLGTVVSLPEDARQVLEESERKGSEASTRIDALSGRLTKACEELRALVYDEQLVRRTEDIDQLHERRIEIRSEKADLPKRQAELDAAEAELRALASELDWKEEEVGALIERIPARAKLRAARSLLGQRGELVSNLGNKAVALEEAEAELAKLQERLGTFGEALDVAGFEAVIKAARESGDITGRVRSAKQHVEHTRDRVDRLLASLHPDIPSEEDAAEMQPPPRMGVQNHRDKVRDWERRTLETAEKLATVDNELQRERKNFESATRDGRVIAIEKLQEARGERDALWRLVKKKHIENAPISDDEAHRHADALDDLAEAFEPAMRTADDLADQRFDNAEAVARLAELSRIIDEKEDGLAQLRCRQEGLTQEAERLAADWQALWDKAQLEPLDPDAMLEWLEARVALLEAMERRAEAEGKLATQREEEREVKESLLAELSSLGADRAVLENDTLSVILERADGVRREYEQEAEAKARLNESLQEAAGIMERRRRELARAKQAWSQWQDEWSTALTELGLATGSNSDAVSAQIEVIDLMREKAFRINELRHERIGKINRDIAAFEADVATIVRELADDLADMAADDVVLKIEKRLDEAQRIHNLQTGKKEEIQEIENNIRAWEEDRQEARDSVNHLKDTAGVDTSDELRSAIKKSDDLRALQGALRETLQTLDQEGDGLAVADLVAECADIDIDRIPAEEHTTDDELEDLRPQLSAAAETRAQARDAFQAIGGGDAAARAEAARQEALAEIRTVSERYVRVRTSALLLQWAIDRYRREKQAPLLERASELFATITGGSFNDLRVAYDEKDRAHLTGLRPSGEAVPVPGMSSGTADQLYFALRVASVEDYLGRADSPPFVADDLFINFDNDRAGAGFEVLGELSSKTQVLFFTHHAHLLDIARKTLGGSISVVSLNGRQADATA